MRNDAGQLVKSRQRNFSSHKLLLFYSSNLFFIYSRKASFLIGNVITLKVMPKFFRGGNFTLLTFLSMSLITESGIRSSDVVKKNIQVSVYFHPYPIGILSKKQESSQAYLAKAHPVDFLINYLKNS